MDHVKTVAQEGSELKRYTRPTLQDLGSVSRMTGMPGGSVGCEGASGKQQRVDTGEDVGGECPPL